MQFRNADSKQLTEVKQLTKLNDIAVSFLWSNQHWRVSRVSLTLRLYLMGPIGCKPTVKCPDRYSGCAWHATILSVMPPQYRKLQCTPIDTTISCNYVEHYIRCHFPKRVLHLYRHHQLCMCMYATGQYLQIYANTCNKIFLSNIYSGISKTN